MSSEPQTPQTSKIRQPGVSPAPASVASTVDECARIDVLEHVILARDGTDLRLVDLPLLHLFTENIYIRQIFMPAGTIVTSKIHKIRHPYAILRGSVSVFIPGQPIQHLSAPFLGITEPGTRRVLFIHEDCVWITFHPNPTNTTDLVELEEFLIEPHNGNEIFDEYARRLTAQQTDERTAIHDDYTDAYLSEDACLSEDQLDYGGAP